MRGDLESTVGTNCSPGLHHKIGPSFDSFGLIRMLEREPHGMVCRNGKLVQMIGVTDNFLKMCVTLVFFNEFDNTNCVTMALMHYDSSKHRNSKQFDVFMVYINHY